MSNVMILILMAGVVAIPVLLGMLMSPVVAAVRDTFFDRRPAPPKKGKSGSRARPGLVFEKEASGSRRKT